MCVDYVDYLLIQVRNRACYGSNMLMIKIFSKHATVRVPYIWHYFQHRQKWDGSEHNPMGGGTRVPEFPLSSKLTSFFLGILLSLEWFLCICRLKNAYTLSKRFYSRFTKDKKKIEKKKYFFSINPTKNIFISFVGFRPCWDGALYMVLKLCQNGCFHEAIESTIWVAW